MGKDGNQSRSIMAHIKSNLLRNIILMVFSFVASIIYARQLGPELYGEYSYAIWFISTLVVIISFGITGTITKFMPEYFFNGKYNESLNFYKIISRFGLVMSLSIVVLLIFTSKYWIDFTSIQDNRGYLLLIVCMSIVPMMLNNFNTSFIQAVQAFSYYAKVNVFFQLIMIAFNIVIVYLYQDISYLITVLFWGNLLQFVAYHIYIKKSILRNGIIDRKNKLKDKKRIIKYSGTMYLNIIWQQIVWTKSEFFFLGIYSNAKAISIYSVAFALNSIINAFFNPIMNVLVNHFAELVSTNKKDVLYRLVFYSTKYFTLFLVPLFFIALIIYEPILIKVYSNQYADINNIFPILFFSTLFSVVMSVGNSLPFYFEKPKFVLLLGLIAGTVNIILNIILIPKYSYLGAAIGSTLSQMFFTIISYIYNIIVFKVKYPIKFQMCTVLIGVLVFIPGYLLREDLSWVFKGAYIIFAMSMYLYLIKLLNLLDDVDRENIQNVKVFINNLRLKLKRR